MLAVTTQDKLRSLKLYGMLRAIEEQAGSAEYAALSFEERLGLMVDREIIEQENRRLSSRLKKAHLRQQACMENIDFKAPRGMDKSLIKSLSTCLWFKDHLNIMITGPCGVGKSFIACALGQKACLIGYTVLYARAPRLFSDLAIARGDGRYSRLMKSFAKTNLLIIDDWGLAVLTDSERRDLLEILEDRHNCQSTIITSVVSQKYLYL